MMFQSKRRQKKKLQEARAKSIANGKGLQVLQPTMKLASSHQNASKLVVGGNLRKPSGGGKVSGSMLFKKKNTIGGSKIRVNKLGSTKLAMNDSSGGNSDDFEDISETQAAAAKAEEEKKQMEEDEEMARRLQAELDLNSGLGNSDITNTAVHSNGSTTSIGAGAVKPTPSPEVKAPTVTAKKQSSMENSMARLKASTGDFFSDF